MVDLPFTHRLLSFDGWRSDFSFTFSAAYSGRGLTRLAGQRVRRVAFRRLVQRRFGFDRLTPFSARSGRGWVKPRLASQLARRATFHQLVWRCFGFDRWNFCFVNANCPRTVFWTIALFYRSSFFVARGGRGRVKPRLASQPAGRDTHALQLCSERCQCPLQLCDFGFKAFDFGIPYCAGRNRDFTIFLLA